MTTFCRQRVLAFFPSIALCVVWPVLAHASVDAKDLDALKQLFRPKPTAACIFPSEGATCQSAERSVRGRVPPIRPADSPQRPQNQPPLLLGRICGCEGAEVSQCQTASL